VDLLQTISRSEYYAALESEDSLSINRLLTILGDDTTDASLAYSGALLMKKSGLKKSINEKIELFKQGRMLLERAIENGNNNPELHFLRLTIQENCPRILNYYDNINEDAELVKQTYKTYPLELKKIVADYS